MSDKKYTIQIDGADLNQIADTGPSGEACGFANARRSGVLWC